MKALLSALTLVASIGCTHTAQLSGTLVAAGGPAVQGVGANPSYGQPLAVNGPQCQTYAQLSRLGSQCTAHETEGGASTDMNSAFPFMPGSGPSTLWFCDGDAVVRLALTPCPAPPGSPPAEAAFQIANVAVSFGKKQQ